jgi:hypothetical protein
MTEAGAVVVVVDFDAAAEDFFADTLPEPPPQAARRPLKASSVIAGSPSLTSFPPGWWCRREYG